MYIELTSYILPNMLNRLSRFESYNTRHQCGSYQVHAYVRVGWGIFYEAIHFFSVHLHPNFNVNLLN